MYLLTDPNGFIDFNPTTGEPPWLEGRVYWDKVNHTLAWYDDQQGTSLLAGQEIRIRVHNESGDDISDGQAVSGVGTNAEGIIEVAVAIASNSDLAQEAIGIATQDIDDGGDGWVTILGTISDIDTSSYTEGAVIWLSETVAGAYQEVRPLSPSFEVRVGIVVVSHATKGRIFAEFKVLSNNHDNNAFFNGSILEPTEVLIVSNGTTVNVSLNSQAANSKLSLMFDQEYISLPDGESINLDLGTDIAPVENWVYITPAGDITLSTSGFPTGTQYVPIVRVIVPSAATAQTYGVYKVHTYTDHLVDSIYQGHLSHLNSWIRKRPATWQNGVVLTQSVAEDTPTATIDLAYTSGLISQLHDHTFPAYDTAVKPAFVINDSVTPYQIANGLTPSIDKDSNGNAIADGRYYNLVVWGTVSQEAKDSKLYFNLPSGSYSIESDAVNDVDENIDLNIPKEYISTGFLLTRFTIKRTTTTVEVISEGTRDLRGITSSGGGASGTGITVFDDLTDTPNKKVSSALKYVRVNAGETALEYSTVPAKYTETPTGAINGTNKDFSVTKIFIAKSTSVFLNGLKQLIGASNDYVEDGGLQLITFEVAPKNIEFTDIIEIVYESIQ